MGDELTLYGLAYDSPLTRTPFRAAPAGSLPVMSWNDQMIARGFGWAVMAGTLSTPVLGGGAGTILDADQPEVVISIPSGTCCRPLRINVSSTAPLLATDADEFETHWIVDRTQKWDGTGTTFVTETPMNLRTDKTHSCPLTVASAFEGNITGVPVESALLGHFQLQGDIQTAVGTTWSGLNVTFDHPHMPFIIGPAMIVGYWGGTVATSAFAAVEVLAFPSSLITSLE